MGQLFFYLLHTTCSAGISLSASSALSIVPKRMDAESCDVMGVLRILANILDFI